MGSIVAEIADKIAGAGDGERSEFEVRGGVGASGGGILTLSTSELTVVDGDILGRIDFQAPLETGTDAIVVSASIYAEADDTFAADNNSTELVFAVGASEAAAEKMRLDHDGQLGIGVATPASLLHVAGTVQVGVDDTGHDVKFFGATSGQYMLWDESADELVLGGDSKLSFHDAAGGENIIASSDGHLEINAGTTLDITAPTVDINAATLVQIDGAVSVGVDDTGHDVIFYGDAAGAFAMWDTSADSLLVRGASADATTSTGRIVLQTALTDINDADVIGRIDFQAPLEAGGSDGILVSASIHAEADATFSATVNSTELVFSTATDDAVVERMRINSAGTITVPGTSHPNFRVTLASNQSISNSTFTKAAFATEQWDHGGNFASNAFTVPAGGDGKYFFLAYSIMTDFADTKFIKLRFYKNGGGMNKQMATYSSVNGTDPYVMISMTEALVATDYIEVYVFQNSGGSKDMRADYSFFSGQRMIGL